MIEGGRPAGGCLLVGGDGDPFLATRDGKAIRFMERQVPARGCLGIRVDPGVDEAVAVRIGARPTTATCCWWARTGKARFA